MNSQIIRKYINISGRGKIKDKEYGSRKEQGLRMQKRKRVLKCKKFNTIRQGHG